MKRNTYDYQVVCYTGQKKEIATQRILIMTDKYSRGIAENIFYQIKNNIEIAEAIFAFIDTSHISLKEIKKLQKDATTVIKFTAENTYGRSYLISHGPCPIMHQINNSKVFETVAVKHLPPECHYLEFVTDADNINRQIKPLKEILTQLKAVQFPDHFQPITPYTLTVYQLEDRHKLEENKLEPALAWEID